MSLSELNKLKNLLWQFLITTGIGDKICPNQNQILSFLPLKELDILTFSKLGGFFSLFCTFVLLLENTHLSLFNILFLNIKHFFFILNVILLIHTYIYLYIYIHSTSFALVYESIMILMFLKIYLKSLSKNCTNSCTHQILLSIPVVPQPHHYMLFID